MANYESLTPDAKNYLAEQYAKVLSHALDPEVMGFTDEQMPPLAGLLGTGTAEEDIKRIFKQIQASGGSDLMNIISDIGEEKGYFKVKGKNASLRDTVISDFSFAAEGRMLNAGGFADEAYVGKGAQERYAGEQGLDLSKSNYQAFGPVADWNVRGEHSALQKPWKGTGLHRGVGEMLPYTYKGKKVEGLLPQQEKWFSQSKEFSTPEGRFTPAPTPAPTTPPTTPAPTTPAPTTPAPTTPAPTTTATPPTAPPIKAPTGLTPKQEERYEETVTTGGPSKDPQTEAARIAAIKKNIPLVSAPIGTTTVPTTSTPSPEKSQQEQIRERLATRGPDPAQQLLNVVSSARATREGLQDKQRAEGRAWIDRLVKNPANWKMGARDPRDERTTREERYGKPRPAQSDEERKRKKGRGGNKRGRNAPPIQGGRYAWQGTGGNPRAEESRY